MYADFLNSPDVRIHVHFPLSVLRERGRKAEGGAYNLLTRVCIHEGNLQIPTTNHKMIREPITRKKLACEVAKLVRKNVEVIKVRVAFASINLFQIFSLSGSNGLSRYRIREHSADEAISRLESVVATGALV